jgi:hypothetical protein
VAAALSASDATDGDDDDEEEEDTLVEVEEWMMNLMRPRGDAAAHAAGGASAMRMRMQQDAHLMRWRGDAEALQQETQLQEAADAASSFFWAQQMRGRGPPAADQAMLVQKCLLY